MFQKLASHNGDIRRLCDKGYAIALDSAYLVIRDIPYLNSQLELKWGAIVDKLVFTDEIHVKQHNHQIYFSGSSPCGLDGKPIPGLGDGSTNLSLGPQSSDIKIERAFSNKRKVNGSMVSFSDFFEKIEHYVGLISGPAIEKYNATPYTFRVIEHVENSVFKFHDTLTSRAEITDLSGKFRDEVVAIIGLGGTGGYLLDYLIKTPVKEIRGFDSDEYHVHNAYRSPGRLRKGELNKKKAAVYSLRYANFRHGLVLKDIRIDSSSKDQLDGVTFAFICVDKGSSRKEIIDLLISLNIPFIDVGMGLRRKKDKLIGMARTTYIASGNANKIRGMNLVEEKHDDPDDEYRVNIQISEMNALNAALAVIRYKQLKGFYLEEESHYHFLFDVQDLKIAANTED